MPSMDREILHDFMENCRSLGLDAPVIDQVAPAPDGRIPEWAENYRETEVEHRHVSHLYCIYPSHRVQSDALQAAAKQSLLKRGFGGTGWSLGWKVCLWARLGDGENALRLIENQLRPINPKALIRVRGGGSYPNLLDATRRSRSTVTLASPPALQKCSLAAPCPNAGVASHRW